MGRKSSISSHCSAPITCSVNVANGFRNDPFTLFLCRILDQIACHFFSSPQNAQCCGTCFFLMYYSTIITPFSSICPCSPVEAEYGFRRYLWLYSSVCSVCKSFFTLSDSLLKKEVKSGMAAVKTIPSERFALQVPSVSAVHGAPVPLY